MSFASDFISYKIKNAELEIIALTDDETKNYLKIRKVISWVCFFNGVVYTAILFKLYEMLVSA